MPSKREPSQSPSEKKANKCRQHLKLLTVADIASGDGRSINNDIFKSNIQQDRVRKYNWPVQYKPKSTDWTVCRRLLRKSIKCAW